MLISVVDKKHPSEIKIQANAILSAQVWKPYCVVIFTLVRLFILQTRSQHATNILTLPVRSCELLRLVLESRYNEQPFCLSQWPLTLSADSCYAGILQFVLVVVVTVELVVPILQTRSQQIYWLSLWDPVCALLRLVKELESRYNGQPFCLFQWPLALTAVTLEFCSLY